MTLSLYQSSVGIFQVSLRAFLGVLDKAKVHAEVKKFDPSVYLTLRLSPNMLPFSSQVQIFSDHAKRASSRLAGVVAPRWDDNETTLADLDARVRKTLDYIATIDRDAVEGGAGREIELPLGPNKMKMPGDDYLLHFALPNYYFHLTTAYDLLRQAGVEIGKRDFLGAVPGIGPA